MKKKFLFLMALLAVSLLALAEMRVYVYQKDGTKVEYLAANVDSIGFVNLFTITFDANGGDGSMEVIKVKEGETITLPANTLTKGSSTFAGWNTQADGTGTAYADKASVSIVASQTLYAQWDAPKDTGIADGHEWVDLGLPSGTKWATCNVGATLPEEYGDYFAWGETEPKSTYNWFTYKWCRGSSSTITKYCTSSDDGTPDYKTTLELEDDAAYVNWGSSWRMPTSSQLAELDNSSYTTWTWTRKNGVIGYNVVSKTNGNSIFLPITGHRSWSDLIHVGSFASYLSCSLHSSNTFYVVHLSLSSGNVNSWSCGDRSSGNPVRPVLRE
jgi:hypothetical protein